MQRLLAPREAANILGVSYPTLKQWIYRGKIKTAKTPGGHHRVPESEIDRLITSQAAGESSGTAFRISISIFLRGRDSLYLKLH